MGDDEEMLVVYRLVAELFAHQSLAAENFVQLQVFAVHHTRRVIGHVDSVLSITRPAAVIRNQFLKNKTKFFQWKNGSIIIT